MMFERPRRHMPQMSRTKRDDDLDADPWCSFRMKLQTGELSLHRIAASASRDDGSREAFGNRSTDRVAHPH